MSPALAGRFSTTAPPGKPSFDSLSMVFFSSFNIFMIAALKSLSAKLDIWTLSQGVSVDGFFPPVYGSHHTFLVSLHVS